MLIVPCWDESDEDDFIARMCDALLLGLGPLPASGDVRTVLPQLSVALVGRTAAQALATA